MPHKKNKDSKQNPANDVSKSEKVGLIAGAACATTGLILSRLLECSEGGCSLASDLPSPKSVRIVGLLTSMAIPVVGAFAAGISESVEKSYEDFRNLPVAQQVVLGIAAYNILVGTAVGGSFFVIANAAAREYLFDAALHFLNAYALNSESRFINAIALVGNIARMMQIDSVLSAGTSTIPTALNYIDGVLNHPSTIFGLGTKWFSKSVLPSQPVVTNEQQASTHRKTM